LAGLALLGRGDLLLFFCRKVVNQSPKFEQQFFRQPVNISNQIQFYFCNVHTCIFFSELQIQPNPAFSSFPPLPKLFLPFPNFSRKLHP